jgi:hypothetical protein
MNSVIIMTKDGDLMMGVTWTEIEVKQLLHILYMFSNKGRNKE